ncbi:MAG TPA: NUDIX domain-containing protein [Caulobacteraceae bacterium]|jgi:8-oxo-dGTP pyrophosphatase MutT (NUDIX family)|nr:NUDIX domain-containing protein [Caulobacteraceae bacterium]
MPTSEPPERTPVRRSAARAFILTPDHHVLLMQIRTPDGLRLWITPGGGIEGDETAEAALLRELEEEVGLKDVPLGALIWRRHHTFSWGKWRVAQSDVFHVVHADRFEPVMADEEEAAMVDAFRWWPLAEIGASADRFVPGGIADILARYIADGAPAEPPPEEVLVD